jgi:ABC-type branched-subunit amino acid transport system substrate-binding protein
MIEAWQIAELHRGGGLKARSVFVLARIALAAMCVAPALADEDAAARGRRLFETGIGRNGRPVEAVFADSATPIPGALLSCAGCHGKDGKGRQAAGANPPDITWQTLTKPYPLQVGLGRTRLPYTDALVLRAVAIGRDSADQLLAPAMPRFRLTPGDAADLVAYLHELGSRADPGVTAEAITIGVILPQRERSPAADDAVRHALGNYIETLNVGGGIFGRRIELAFLDAAVTSDPAHFAAGVAKIEEKFLAALVGATGAGEDEAPLLTRQHDIPLIALRADKDVQPARNVFYLDAGMTGELAALAAQAARELHAGSGRLAIVYADRNEDRQRVMALRPLIERSGWSMVDEIAVPTAGTPEGAPERVMHRIESSEAVLFAGRDASFVEILSHLGRTARGPLVLLAGSLVDPKTLPRDMGAETRILFAYAPDGAAPRPAVSASAETLAAMKLLVEGLRRAGRDVSRAKLIEALETIRRFETGYGAPVSYGPRRHIGFMGAEVVRLDPRRLEPNGAASRIELH